MPRDAVVFVLSRVRPPPAVLHIEADEDEEVGKPVRYLEREQIVQHAPALAARQLEGEVKVSRDVVPEGVQEILLSVRAFHENVHAPDRALERICECQLSVADETVEPRPRVGRLLLFASRAQSGELIVCEHGVEGTEDESIVQVREEAKEDGQRMEVGGNVARPKLERVDGGKGRRDGIGKEVELKRV